MTFPKAISVRNEIAAPQITAKTVPVGAMQSDIIILRKVKEEKKK